MKRILLTISAMAFVGMISVYGQSEIIINEDFQDWLETVGTDTSDCASGAVNEYQVTREMELLTSSGTVNIPVTMVQVAIQPTCDSRRVIDGGATENTPGVTTGWVQLNKLNDENNTIETFEDSGDTLGEFIFGPIPEIDSIVFAHSATGSQRGIRIYVSDDGEDWERPTEDEFWDGADCQAGDVNSVEIFMTDVYVKFTSGFKMSDQTSQFTRLHNITVYGEPGELAGINKQTMNDINIYAIQGTENFKIEGNISGVEVYNMVGVKVNNSFVEETGILDLSGNSKGIYVIKMFDRNGNSFARKVYKQ